MGSLPQPQQRQQESKETPGRKSRQEEEVGHHRPQRQKDEVVRQPVKGQAWNYDGSRESQDIKGLLGEIRRSSLHSIEAQPAVDGEEEEKGDVEEGP